VTGPHLLNEAVARHDDAEWARHALEIIQNDQRRSADTHLLRLDIPALEGIDLYLKDESTHPTGSLKHRLARSLFLYSASATAGSVHDTHDRRGIVRIDRHLRGLLRAACSACRSVAVMPRRTSPEKVALIERTGGSCHFVDEPGAIYEEAARLATSVGGHYMDQFTFSERATDWRGNNNIAESIFGQMTRERHPIPCWVVVGAGTGGTSATIGRYVRYRRLGTQLLVADPEGSAFYDGWTDENPAATACGSRIEGIGRPRVEPSFVPSVIDRMLRVPDVTSLAAMRVLSRQLGRKVGGSTGTNFFALCLLASRMRADGLKGSLVSLICDSGERYGHTYYNDDWIAAQGFDLSSNEAALEAFLQSGEPLL
jgi:cysteine synthase A